MHVPSLLPLILAVPLLAQAPPPYPHPLPDDDQEDVRLPNGKLQRDEIVKAEYQRSVEDARQLAKLADELKADLEKTDRNVLSITTLKKTEEIEKLAKRIHDRMKHF